MLKAGWIGFLQENFWEGAQKLKDIGYQVMDSDLSRAEGDLKENYKRFIDMGLTPLTVGCGFDLPEAAKDPSDMIAKAKAQNITRVTAFGSSMISSFFMGYGNNAPYETVMKDFEAINALIPKLADEGLVFCYHNHYQEFSEYYKGVAGIDQMLINCDPRLMFDLDVGWATVGGADPVELMKRLEGRLACIHLKDFYDLEGPKHMDVKDRNSLTGFTSLGSGVVDLAGVLVEMDRQGIRDAIVEQDTLRNLDLFETLTASYLRIKESGLVE